MIQIMCLKVWHTMAQIAVNMDQEGPENPLQGEEVYFDGSHL